MTILPMFLLLSLQTQVPALLEEGRYLSAALALKEKAHSLEDPVILRRYTEVLTEYYSREVTFKVFFFRDLESGQTLAKLRAQKNQLTVSEVEQVIEDQLDRLLVSAQKKYPNNIHIRFAVAQYLFRGSCCKISSKLKMNNHTIIKTFKEAKKEGIFSAGSLYAIANDYLSQPKPHREKIRDYLDTAVRLNPHDPAIRRSQMEERLHRKQYKEAGTMSRKLFNLSPSPFDRSAALLGAARAFFGLKQYPEALKAVHGGMEITPQDNFLLVVGLDALRAMNNGEAYHQLMVDFLSHEPESPSSFQAYLNYLQVRGLTSLDEGFAARYEDLKSTSPLATVTQQTNLGLYHARFGSKKDSLSHLQEARKQAKKIEDPPADLMSTLNNIIKTVEARSRDKFKKLAP